MDNNTLREMIIAKMQNGNFDLKPCPFCGGKPTLMSKERFERLESLGDSGTACIEIECHKCSLDFYDHTHNEHDYYIRAFLITEKWNRRAE